MQSGPSAAASPPSAAGSGGLHVLFLDPFFSTPTGPGLTRTYDMSRRLADAGHRVSVIATTATAPQERLDGIALTALHVPGPAQFGFPVREEALRAFGRRAWWAMWRTREVDVLVTTAAPAAALPAAWLFSRRRGIPLILDVREPLPTGGTDIPGKLATWTARLMVKLAARAAHRIIAASPVLANALTAMGIAAEKITTAGPGCDLRLFAVPSAQGSDYILRNPHLAGGPLVVFAGAMRDSLTMLAAVNMAAGLSARVPTARIVLCGDGPVRPEVLSRAQERGILNSSLWLMGPLARRELPELLGAAAIVLALPQGAGLNGHIYDALAAGKPVAVMGAAPERDVVDSRGAGFGLPADPDAAAQELADILRDADGMRRAASQAAALAASRLSTERITGEVRMLVELTAAEAPRAAVLRRRTLRKKRLFDVLGAAAILIVLSPIFAAIAVTLWAKKIRPVFSADVRTGARGRAFKMFIFHRERAEGSPLDVFLARTGLALLPTLFNVLAGHMSFVGPQPLPPDYQQYYDTVQRRRLDVRPGLTGWSQVNRDQGQTWETTFAGDAWYADNVGFGLDLKILFKALFLLLLGRGGDRTAQAMLPPFNEIEARRQGGEDT